MIHPSGGMRRLPPCWPLLCRRSAVLVTACMLCSLLPGRAQSRVDNEYRFKAVYLLNFLQFIQWRADSSAGQNSGPIIIGVAGEDPFGPLLDQTVTGELVGGRRIVVRRFRDIAEVDSCNLLFIPRTLRKGNPPVLRELARRGIVTVGESGEFATEGPVLNFYLNDGKLRFEINETALREAGFTISSRLMKLARIIPSNGE